MEAYRRRCQSNLIYSGMSFIAFGVWDVIKFLLYIYFQPYKITDIINGMDLDASNPELVALAKNILAILFFIIFTIDILFHIYVGLSAIKEGQGKKKRKIYIFLAGLYGLFTLGSSVFSLLKGEYFEFSATITSVVVDITSCFAIVMIIISSVKLYQIGKMIEKRS